MNSGQKIAALIQLLQEQTEAEEVESQLLEVVWQINIFGRTLFRRTQAQLQLSDCGSHWSVFLPPERNASNPIFGKYACRANFNKETGEMYKEMPQSWEEWLEMWPPRQDSPGMYFDSIAELIDHAYEQYIVRGKK